MIVAALAVIYKIYRGSKNKFAYVLMSFTVLLGACNVCFAFIEAFRKCVPLPDRTHCFYNFYANETFIYLEMLCALQGWVFAVRYWLSATISSLSGSWFTSDCIKVIGWLLAVLYITAQTIILVWHDITFPGFIDSNNSLTTWIVWAIKISYEL